MEELLDEFMEKYENRNGLKEEEQLDFYLDYAIRDENFLEQTYVRANDAKDRFDRVKKLLQETPDDVIDSNIYLKKCKEFIKNSCGDSADLFLEHKCDNKLLVKKEISTDMLLPSIDDYEVRNLDIVKDYNAICKKVRNMYVEICRLNIWEMINQERFDSKYLDNVSSVYIQNESGNKANLCATFLDLNKLNNVVIDSYVKTRN